MKLKLLFTLFFVFFGASIYAFTPKADAYLQQYRKAAYSETGLKALIDFCGEYKTYPYDTLKKYASDALLLSRRLQNENFELQSKFWMATYFYRTSQLDSALNICNQLEKSKIRNVPIDRKNKLLISSILIKKGQNQEAISRYFKLLEESDIQKDTLSYLSAMHGLGWANMEINRTDEAKKWLLNVLNMPVSSRWEEIKIPSYINLSTILGIQNNLDSANTLIQNAIELSGKFNNLLNEANSYNILANIYSARGWNQKAIDAVKKSMQIRLRIGDPFYIVSDLAQLSGMYAEMGNYMEGISLALKAWEMTNEKRLASKKPLVLDALFKNYYGSGNYKKSTETLLLIDKIKDSTNIAVSAEKISEIEAKYELSKKEITIKNQENEINRKNLIILFALISLIGILITGFVIYRSLQYIQQTRIKTIELEQQQKLTQSIFETEENEKTRIGASLHDGLGQLLSAIKMNMQFIQNHLNPDNRRVDEVYNKTLDLVEASIRETRDVSHELVTNFIISKGFKTAIEDLVNKPNGSGLEFEISILDIPNTVSDTIKINVYRIIQECINNILKHAHATKVYITLEADEEYIHCIIEDNGQGFDLQTVKKNGIGIDNICTRVHFLKGTIDITSHPGNGAMIAFHIPME